MYDIEVDIWMKIEHISTQYYNSRMLNIVGLADLAISSSNTHKGM